MTFILDGAKHILLFQYFFSGLPDYWDSDPFVSAFNKDVNRFWTPQEVLTYAAKMKKRAVGKYHYSDTNFVLLGLLVEAKAGNNTSSKQRYYDKDTLGSNPCNE